MKTIYLIRHSGPFVDIDNYNDSVDKYIEVFRNIFIKTGNEAHYKMMMLVE